MKRPVDVWTITVRNKWIERIPFALRLLFRWPTREEQK